MNFQLWIKKIKVGSELPIIGKKDKNWKSTSNLEEKRQKLEVYFQLRVKTEKVGSLLPINKKRAP